MSYNVQFINKILILKLLYRNCKKGYFKQYNFLFIVDNTILNQLNMK